MIAIALTLGGKSGDYIKTLPVVTDSSEGQRSSSPDGVVIAVFLLFASAVIYFLLG